MSIFVTLSFIHQLPLLLCQNNTHVSVGTVFEHSRAPDCAAVDESRTPSGAVDHGGIPDVSAQRSRDSADADVCCPAWFSRWGC